MRRLRYRQNNFLLKITAIILSISFLLIFCFYKMRPVILSYAASAAENIMLVSANDAILEILNSGDISYDDIITLSRDAEGQVTSLETNIVKINSLKSLMANKLSGIIAQKEYYEVSIPLGSFFSNVYTSGLGPKLNFKMQLSAVAKVNFSHEFKSAGINQVLHIVMIDMTISGGLVIAGYKDVISSTTSAMAAQTIIVGTTPEAFTQVIENETDNTAGLINDYGAVAGK